MKSDMTLHGQNGRHEVRRIGKSRWGLKGIVGLVFACFSFASVAMPPKRITAQEKALLPPYCKHTQGVVGHENPQMPSAGAKNWVNAFGGQGLTAHLWRMHHYCYALIHMMRGQRAGLTRMEYKEAWLGVIDEIDFTLQFMPPDFVLLPEMMLNRGRALMRLKKHEAAMNNFQQAIDLKADYWPPYLDIADYQVSTGDKAKAIEVLRQGLKNVPDAKALRLRLTELGVANPVPSPESAAPTAARSSPEQP